VYSVVPDILAVPLLTVNFALVIVDGSMATLNVAEIFPLKPMSVASFSGLVEDTLGLTPGSSSCLQAEINTIINIAMTGNTFLNCIFVFV
jgi:hypothetical protein